MKILMPATSAWRCLRIWLGAVAVALLAACAHPITIEPTQSLARDEGKLLQRKVAYLMTDADRQKEFTSPGGGGDKLSYFPYRDLERSLRDTLRSIYQDVSVVRSTTDATAIRDAGVSYIFVPDISTTSSSSSLLTWPPTQFSVQVICTVTDPAGQTLEQLRVTGNGNAEFSEFKRDPGLAAKRASADAAAKLAQEIAASDKLR